MHHPAFETGIVWLDKLRLVDEDIFWGILNPYTPNILGLFTAHLHRQFICSFKDVLSVGCPSVSWQFSGNADASKGEVSDEPPGFNLIDISEEGIRTQTIRFSVNN